MAAAPRKGAAAQALCRGGGSPAAQGRGVRAWGLRWGVRKGSVGSIWVEEGRRRSSTWSGRPAAVWTAAAPFQWVGAVVEGSGSTSERRGTRFRGWLGSRESGGRGSAAAYGGAAAMAWAAAFQGAGSGGRARFGVERRGEEREREVARQNGEKRAAEGSSAGEELRAAHWRGRRLVASSSSSRSAGTRAWHSEGRRALERGAGSTTGTGAGWRGRATGQ